MAAASHDPRVLALLEMASEPTKWQRYLDTMAEAPDTALNTAIRAKWGLENDKGPYYEILCIDEIERPWVDEGGNERRARVRGGEEPIFRMCRRVGAGQIRMRPYYLPSQVEDLRLDRYLGRALKATTSKENASLIEEAQEKPPVRHALATLTGDSPDDTRLEALRSEALLYCLSTRYALPLDEPPALPPAQELGTDALVTWCNGLAEKFREIAATMDRTISRCRQYRKSERERSEAEAEKESPSRRMPSPDSEKARRLEKYMRAAQEAPRLAGDGRKAAQEAPRLAGDDRKAALENTQARSAADALAAAARAAQQGNGQQGRGGR